MVIMEYQTSFTSTDLQNLSSINHDFSKMIPNTIRWLRLDLSPLCEPRYNYESQATISSRRVEMASAAMIHFGLDPGKLVRWLGGKYTGEHCDVNRTLMAVRDHVSLDGLNHMKIIILDGSPWGLTFNEPLTNKSLMIQQENSKSFKENPELVLTTMNKEDRYTATSYL